MVQLLDAERLRLRGATSAALVAYAQGSERAIEQRYVHHAAFIHERRGRLLLSLGRDLEARSAIQRAGALYDEWGAAVKAAEMRRLGSKT